RAPSTPTARSAQPYGHRDREIADMRNRDGQRGLQTDRFASRFSTTVKRDRRLTGSCSPDLDLSPADAANAQTEDLRDGFLRSPSPGEMQDVRAAVHLLPLRIHAVEKSPRMLLEHVADPRGLDDVDADFGAHARSGRVRRVLSPVRGRALAAPSPPCASFAALTPRGGGPGHPRLAHTPLTGATRRTNRSRS